KPKGALEVTGQKEKTVLSRYKVRYDEIKRMPGTLGEALNALQTLPGVFSPPFSFGNLVIRGADPDANTYLYDDLPIFYAYHFDTINSVIHNDLIKTIDLYTGAYPANYANALGGVIEIESTEEVKKPSGQFSSSILLSQGMYQTPLWEGKGYLAVGGKIGYLDRTIGQSGLVPEGIRLPRYTSTNAKFSYAFNPEHKVSFTSITAQDSFVLNAPSKTQNDPTQDQLAAVAGINVSAGRGFQTVGLRYIWTPGTKFNNRFTLIYFNPFVDTNVTFNSIKLLLRARAPYIGLRQDASWTATDWFKIDFGTEVREASYRIEGYTPAAKDPLATNSIYDNDAFTTSDISESTKIMYYSAHTNLHFTFGKLSFEPGARYDYIGFSKRGVVGPRGVISYKIDGLLKGTKIFAGAGDYYRFPFFDAAVSSKSGNPDIKFEKAFKYSGGLEQYISENWLAKFELFKNEFSNLVTSDAYISEPFGRNAQANYYQLETFIRNIPLSSPYVSNKSLGYSNSGSGWAHGFEVFIKKSNKPNSRDWYGWLSYTWSQTFRNPNRYDKDYDPYKELVLTGREQRFRSLFPNTQELIYEFDITHLVSLVYGWRINKEFQVGGRWQYRTAYPYTPIIGDDGGQYTNAANNQTIWSAKYSDNPWNNDYKNSRRQPPYHRLDIRIDRFLNYEWGYMNVYLEIINVYMRENTLSESYSNTMPYSRTNPGPQGDFFVLKSGGIIMPFYNLGMEVRF
ncbi:MAG: TonB-dependent receptor plug domain-containing protein, partial [Leptospiraceae bacterium]|nr:TonB-dependent receptor plug domain-containing protein [Leptospiraceae bacterium]